MLNMMLLVATMLTACEPNSEALQLANKNMIIMSFKQKGCYLNHMTFAAAGENRDRYIVICKTEDRQTIAWKGTYGKKWQVHISVPHEFRTCGVQFLDGPVRILRVVAYGEDPVCLAMDDRLEKNSSTYTDL